MNVLLVLQPLASSSKRRPNFSGFRKLSSKPQISLIQHNKRRDNPTQLSTMLYKVHEVSNMLLLLVLLFGAAFSNPLHPRQAVPTGCINFYIPVTVLANNTALSSRPGPLELSPST
jgi:hypothetical protein